MGNDVVVAFEAPVREPVFAEEPPDILHRVQLGRARRQRQDGHILWHDESAGEMHPARSRISTACASGTATALISARWACITAVSQKGMTSGTLAFGRTDRPEDIRPLGALVLFRPRPGPPPGPAAREIVLLPDARPPKNQSSMRLPGCAALIPAKRSGIVF